MSEDLDYQTASAMQAGKPFKTYKKVVLGRVYVSALDPFTGQPSGVMLYGDPKRDDKTCYIDMWTERDDNFFKRANEVHFKAGYILESRPIEKKEEELPIEQYSDDQLKGIINLRYLALQAKLNKIESEPVLYRMIGLAKDMEKSAKISGAIEARLSEVQGISVDQEEE